MRISDWSSDVCSSESKLCRWSTWMPAASSSICPKRSKPVQESMTVRSVTTGAWHERLDGPRADSVSGAVSRAARPLPGGQGTRSEDYTSELQSLMRTSYAVFCFKKTNTDPQTTM